MIDALFEIGGLLLGVALVAVAAITPEGRWRLSAWRERRRAR